jgi:hypothetical protein
MYSYIDNYSNRFLQQMRSGEGGRRTRVAILDSGILTIPPLQAEEEKNSGLWPRIAEGETFIDNTSRLPPWQFASDPHGTQIANVISAIDPHCEIYVAKVTESRHGILPDNVADVCFTVSPIHIRSQRKLELIQTAGNKVGERKRRGHYFDEPCHPTAQLQQE